MDCQSQQLLTAEQAAAGIFFAEARRAFFEKVCVWDPQAMCTVEQVAAAFFLERQHAFLKNVSFCEHL